MIKFKNKQALDSYTEKINRFQDNDICFCEEENKSFKYNAEKNEWNLIESEGISISLYDLNKQLAMQLPPLEESDYKDFMKIVEDFRTEHKSSYYMILCKELSFYTIFAKDNYEKNSLEEAVLDYCISTGPIHSVSLTENNDAIEIWIEYENEVYVFYLFDYVRGVINFN